MQAIARLTGQGYTLAIDQDEIVIRYIGQGQPDPATVRPLLQALKEHKAEAITFLRQREQGPAADSQLLTTGTIDEMNALGAACREQIRSKGFCLVKSAAMGETIAVVDSDHHRRLAPSGHIVYTLAELELIAEGYRAGTIVSIKDLQLLHTAKKQFKGVIVQ